MNVGIFSQWPALHIFHRIQDNGEYDNNELSGNYTVTGDSKRTRKLALIRTLVYVVWPKDKFAFGRTSYVAEFHNTASGQYS